MRKRFTNKQELQICKDYFSKERPSTLTLGKKWRCTDKVASNVIKRNGYDLRPKGETQKIFTKKEEQQICKDYFSKEKPSADTLAEKYNCGNETIREIIIKNENILRPLSEAIRVFTKEQELQICKDYFSKEKPSAVKLAKPWNCSYSTIRNIVIRNKGALRSLKETQSTPKAICKILKNGFGTKCYYHNKFFPSLGERDCYIIFIDLGYIVIHNFLGRFDFLVILQNKEKVVVEFHPYDITGLTNKQYYNQRRKLLNKYEYKNLKLVVIKNLKEIEHNRIFKDKNNQI